MFHDLLFLLLGLILLVGGANYMTDGAVSVAKRFRVPTLIIGLTVVALGSSMPDIVVCVESALEGKTAIAVGEVIGANIFDLLLVIGIMGVVRPWKVSSIMRSQDLPLLFIASTALWIAGDTILFDGAHHNLIDRTSGAMLLIIFIFYMWFMIQASRNSLGAVPTGTGTTDSKSSANPANTSSQHQSPLQTLSANDKSDTETGTAFARSIRATEERITSGISYLRGRQWFSWVMIAGGLGALVIGGNWVVDGASGLALKAGMSQGMVALTVVAIGNSLPDLVTSVTATLKGASGIALGNIVGACIINALLAIGLSAVIRPLGADTIGFVDFLTLAGASLLLWLIPALRPSHRIGRFTGILFILLYAAYMVFTIIRG